MRKLRSNMLVAWQVGPQAHPMKLIGHVVSVNDETALVQSNGAVYEVARERLKTLNKVTHLRPVCRHCGKACKFVDTEHCSRECLNATVKGKTDADVFAALVDYKSQNDGITPTIRQLARMTGWHRTSVNAALLRLENAGRIWAIGSERHRQIGVVGGKWVYEGR